MTDNYHESGEEECIFHGEEEDVGLFYSSEKLHNDWCKYRAATILRASYPVPTLEQVDDLAQTLAETRYPSCWDGSHAKGRSTMHDYRTAKERVRRDEILSMFPSPFGGIRKAVLAFCGHPADPNFSSMVIRQGDVSICVWEIISTGRPHVSVTDKNLLELFRGHQEDVFIRKELFVCEAYSLKEDDRCAIYEKITEIFDSASDSGTHPARHDPIPDNTFLVNVICISLRKVIQPEIE